jgi:hypothetical protein
MDLNYIKENINARQEDIFNLVDTLLPNDNISKIIDKYKDELTNYSYVDTVGKFSLLELKGSIKYINKYDKELRNGGLVTKIYKNKENGKWYAVILKMKKKFYISFDNNYIFYLDSKEQNMRRWAQCFISEVDKGLYDIE